MIVAPLVGAWIESVYAIYTLTRFIVAPLVGAWIERLRTHILLKASFVAPLVGAWIESASLLSVPLLLKMSLLL